MKKFNVECKKTGEEYADNYLGEFITAETAEEAIECTIDCMMGEINSYGYGCKIIDGEIAVYENGKLIEKYFDFEAKEIEK